MTGWVDVLERVILDIGIQVQTQRVARAAPVCVLAQEPRSLRVVVPRLQVVQPRFVVVHIPRVPVWIVRATRRAPVHPERIVVIARYDVAGRVDDRRHIAPPVVHIVLPVAADQLVAVHVHRCLRTSAPIDFQDYPVVLVQAHRLRTAVHPLTVPQPRSVAEINFNPTLLFLIFRNYFSVSLYDIRHYHHYY